MTQHASLLEPGSRAPGILRTFGDAHFHVDGDLLGLAFDADGVLWSVEEPGVVRQWNLTGQQVAEHSLSDLETLWVLDAGARLLASASDDLAIWDVATGQLLQVIAQQSWVSALAFGGGSRLIATGHDDGFVRLWEVGSGRLRREFSGSALAVSAIAISPEGKRVAFAGEDCVIYLWDLETGRDIARLSGHTDRIGALAWHPHGQRLVSASWDTTARLWDSTSGQPVLILNNHSSQVTAVAFSGDGRLLASADAGDSIHVWDLEARSLRHRFVGHRDSVSCLVFRADGAYLASGGEDRIIRLWDVRPDSASGTTSNAVRVEHPGWQQHGGGLALDGAGTRLATLEGSGLQVFDSVSAASLLHLEDNVLMQSLAYSSDNRWIAGGGADGVIRLWEANTGKLHARLYAWEQPEPVTALSFAPDSAMLASASALRTEVWLWHVAGGEPVLLIPDAAIGCAIEALAFHPAGRLLATAGIDWLSTGGSDGAVSIWDLAEHCEIATFPGGSKAVAFHPSGRYLAAASLVRSICIWDIENGLLTAELLGHEDTVNCVALSPDGRYLASGGDDRTLHLWDSTDAKLLATHELGTQIKHLAFSPDGRFLYTGNSNLTCYQLDVQQLAAGH